MLVQRMLLSLQLALLVAPVALFALFWGTILAAGALSFGEDTHIVGLVAVADAGLVALLWLSTAFLKHGYDGLVRAHPAWWVAASGGALAAIGGLAVVLTGPHGYPVKGPAEWFAFGVFGIPCLVPFMHVTVLRLIAGRANNSSKPTPLRGAA